MATKQKKDETPNVNLNNIQESANKSKNVWPSRSNREKSRTTNMTSREEDALQDNVRTLDNMFRRVVENYHRVSVDGVTDDPGLAHSTCINSMGKE